MSSAGDATTQARVPLVGDEYLEVQRFIFEEARLADESRYVDWETLVDDDMYYWVPRGEGDWDRDTQVSITADNRGRLANRLKQLRTGTRHAQVPPSPMRRIVSNIEAYREQNGEYAAGCNFVLYELRVQSTGQLQVWPGRAEYRLRRKDGSLKMFLKKVMLVNGDTPLTSLAFIL